MDIVVIKIL